eukprot:scaffold30523_cov30-Prasinocladus_malaysianus.AAC.2
MAKTTNTFVQIRLEYIYYPCLRGAARLVRGAAHGPLDGLQAARLLGDEHDVLRGLRGAGEGAQSRHADVGE